MLQPAAVVDPTIDTEFATPMMQQYMQLKEQYSDCLLFFRLGDFYELFLDDAKIGAKVLGITLTGRSRGKDGRIPMAGVPYHAVDSYLAKLIKAGYKVAICEQVSLPNGKGLVDREVIRVITPGTFLDEKHLVAKDHNYLVSLSRQKKTVGVAAVDLSTGDFHAGEQALTPHRGLSQVLADVMTHFHPSEIIVAPTAPDTADELLTTVREYPHILINPYADWNRWTRKAAQAITDYFQLASLHASPLAQHPQGQIAAAALLGYIQHTQKAVATHIHRIQPLFAHRYVHLDRSTIRNLELLAPLQEDHRALSFLETIDYTITAMGGRLLKQWLLQPLVDKTSLLQRQDKVAFLVTETHLRHQVRQTLHQVVDIERLLSRLSTRLGTPRDVQSLAQSLHLLTELRTTLPPTLADFSAAISPDLQDLHTLITTTLVDDPPISHLEGGIIRPGLDRRLDQLRQTAGGSRDWIAKLEAQERQRSGITSLKIKYNQVFGFYIEVSKANLATVPADYERKQTLVNAERFTTPELKKHEQIILGAEEQSHQLESKLFLELVAKILKQVAALHQGCQAVAELDCWLALAELADTQGYTRPTLVETGDIDLKHSFHPVVARLIGRHRFVANDVFLSSHQPQLLLITGPNMAGKSVLMRQVALCTLLAQMGSFVPAQAATISLVDQIFVRSGAADMITAGLSTFMVEMVETAYILRQATDRSLIIMDEIGRGTSTYDGISIAWAVAEFLVSQGGQPKTVGPKTLFATHYHELQDLAETWPTKIINVHMAMTEHHHQPVFLYQLTPGGASHSFGVAVAQLAGIPAEVVTKAQTLLHQLENRADTPPTILAKTSASRPAVTALSPTLRQLQTKLKAVKLNTLTPLAALNLLAEWQNTLTESQSDPDTHERN